MTLRQRTNAQRTAYIRDRKKESGATLPMLCFTLSKRDIAAAIAALREQSPYPGDIVLSEGAEGSPVIMKVGGRPFALFCGLAGATKLVVRIDEPAKKRLQHRGVTVKRVAGLDGEWYAVPIDVAFTEEKQVFELLADACCYVYFGDLTPNQPEIAEIALRELERKEAESFASAYDPYRDCDLLDLIRERERALKLYWRQFPPCIFSDGHAVCERVAAAVGENDGVKTAITDGRIVCTVKKKPVAQLIAEGVRPSLLIRLSSPKAATLRRYHAELKKADGAPEQDWYFIPVTAVFTSVAELAALFKHAVAYVQKSA